MDIKQIVFHIYNISCKTEQLKVALDKESSYFPCRSGKNKAMMNSRAAIDLAQRTANGGEGVVYLILGI